MISTSEMAKASKQAVQGESNWRDRAPTTGKPTFIDRLLNSAERKIGEFKRHMHFRAAEKRPIGQSIADKVQLNPKFTQSSIADKVNQTVATGKEVASAGQERARAAVNAAREHTDELVGVGQGLMLATTLAGGMRVGAAIHSPESPSSQNNRPAYVATVPKSELKVSPIDFVAAAPKNVAPAEVASSAVAQPESRPSPFDFEAVANIENMPIATPFVSQPRPEVLPPTAAEVAEVVTQQEQQMAGLEPSPSPAAGVSRPDPDTAQAQADAVTEAERVLAASQPALHDAPVASPSVAEPADVIVTPATASGADRNASQPQPSEQRSIPNKSEIQAQARTEIIAKLLPNLPSEHSDELNTQIDEWMDASEKNYAQVLPQLIASYDSQISALADQYNIPKFMFYAHMLGESNGDPLARSDSSDAVGLFQFTIAAAKDAGLIVDLENGIDERLIPEKAIPAFARYFVINQNFLGGGLAFGMQGFKAGMGNERSYIMLADPEKRPEWGAAARDTNPYSIMQNPEVIKRINEKGDPDDFIYPVKIVAAAIQYELALAQASR